MEEDGIEVALTSPFEDDRRPTLSLLWVELCSPKDVLESQPLSPGNVTLLTHRALADIIRLR